jgi:HTH-type transcriptional regulator/antitoxin HigA
MPPFKKIRTDADYAQARKMSGRLIGLERKLTIGESEYLDALVVLIREYEQALPTLKLPQAGGISVLKHLMSEHQMTQRALAQMLGIGESATSMILAGSRELTRSHIDKLSRHFGVGAGAFFG